MNRRVIGRFSRTAAYWRTFLQPESDAVIMANHALPSRLCLATQSCFMPALSQHRFSPITHVTRHPPSRGAICHRESPVDDCRVDRTSCGRAMMKNDPSCLASPDGDHALVDDSFFVARYLPQGSEIARRGEKCSTDSGRSLRRVHQVIDRSSSSQWIVRSSARSPDRWRHSSLPLFRAPCLARPCDCAIAGSRYLR